MVKVKEDLTGKIFGRLTVLEQAEDYAKPNGKKEAQWMCKCSCYNNTICIIRGRSLKSGNTTSCGCLQKEITSVVGSRNKKYNQFSEKLYDEHGEYYIGYASNTGAKFYIDADDFDKVNKYCWNERITRGMHQLVSTVGGKHILLHQFLGFRYYDHEDRNELNNRKYNLRKCTHLENSRNKGLYSNNSSGVTGVRWKQQINKWQSYITVNKKLINLGIFDNVNDAIRSRLKAELKYFKEFAPQRHLFATYNIT